MGDSVDSDSLIDRGDLSTELVDALRVAFDRHPEFAEMLLARATKGHSAALDWLDDRTVDLTVRPGE